MTIDELSTVAGVPSRTIREYQRLGLLNPPRRDGRVGKYGAEHRARLAIIARLQERGYSLAAIADLIRSWEQGRGLGSVLGVNANPAVLDETPTELSRERLHAAVPELADPDQYGRALDAGLIKERRDGSLMIRSVAALDLVGLATEAGMPADAAIGIVSALRSGAEDAARAAVDAFTRHLWPPTPDDPDPVTTLSRARLLLAQAAASLLVHELGEALSRAADQEQGSDQLSLLIEQLSIGITRSLAELPEAQLADAGVQGPT